MNHSEQNLTAVILCYNEEKNIKRSLDSLKWLSKVIIVDSNSNDATLKIISKYTNVICYNRNFDNHTNQWNFGIDKAKTDWILSMDADYIVTDELRVELQDLELEKEKNTAYNISFKYCVNGKRLRATILPPRLALFNKQFSRYIQDGHTQLLKTSGKKGYLKNKFLHDDRKPLSRWFWAQERYANLELEKLKVSVIKLSFTDRLRKKIIIAPFAVFVYCYILKLGFLDGKYGLYYALQRVYAELVISLKIIESKF